MVIAARGRGQYLIIRCCWAFGTGCLQKKAEPRTLTDMTFLKFAAIYVSLLPLFLFYISPASLFLAFFFPRAHSTLPPSPCTLPRPKLLAVRSRQSSSSFLFYLLFLSPPPSSPLSPPLLPCLLLLDVSTSRFPRSFYFAPSFPPRTAYID